MYSCISNVNIFYSFQLSETPGQAAVMMSDPGEIPIPASNYTDILAYQSDLATRYVGPLTIVLDTLSFSESIGDSSATRSGHGDDTERIQYYRLSVLKGDLSVFQSILEIQSKSLTALTSHEPKILERGVPGPFVRNSIDNFILSPHMSDYSVLDNARSSRTFKNAEKRGGHLRLNQDDPWTLNMEWLLLEVLRLRGTETINLQDALKNVQLGREREPAKKLLLPKTL